MINNNERYLRSPSGILHMRASGPEDDALSFHYSRCGWYNELGSTRIPGTLFAGWQQSVCKKCRHIEP